MKNLNIFWLLFVLFIISCGIKESNIPIYGYLLQKDNMKTFTLNIIKKEGLINFEYRHQIDTVANVEVIYNLEENILISDLDTFSATAKVYNSKSLEFKLYETKGIRSHNSTLVFNKKYGLLASFVFGKDFIFLKDSISVNTKELIFKELFLELNKVLIE